MLNRLVYRVNTARQILKTEGLASLLKRLGRFIKWRCFVCVIYYLYETTAEDFRTLNEADFKPKINSFIFEIVSSNEEADTLEAEGFEFRSHDIWSRYFLDNGAVVFCIFVDNELANIGWIEMTRQLSEIDIMKVDYSNNEVHVGWVWTSPKYRGLGFGRYIYFKKVQLAFSRGKTVIRTSINKSNIASQSTITKNNKKYAIVRYLKILGWKSIKTTYVDGYKPNQSPISLKELPSSLDITISDDCRE